MWDTDKEKKIKEASDILLKTLKGHADNVRSVSFSPDGKHLASGSSDKTIKLWSITDGNLIKTLEGHSNGVMSVAFSPDGKYIASGSSDKTIKLWSIPAGNLIKTLEGHSNGVMSVAFSPDGKYIASGSSDKTIKLWSIPAGNLIKTLEGHADNVRSVAFSPDRKYLASGSWDKTIKLWSITDGNLIKTLTGHTYHVFSVAFSPDGKYLASGGGDNTIKLWSITAGNLIKTLEGHAYNVFSVAFSPNGKYLASGGGDNTIKLWGIPRGAEQEVCNGKFPPQVYTFIAKVLQEKKKYSEAIRIIDAQKEHYPEAVDYELYFSLYKTIDKVDEIKPDTVPPEYKCRIVDAMMKKGKDEEALKILSNKPESEWTDKDYDLCMKLYVKLDMYDLAKELFNKLRKQKSLRESPDLYYDFALFCEGMGKIKGAVDIYKSFLEENFIYKDVVKRYPALKNQLSNEVENPTTVKRPKLSNPFLGKDTITESSARFTQSTGNRFEILREIGRGGMGVIYEAKDKELGRRVAIKRMRDEIAITPREMEKFIQEARTVARLKHPNIVDIYDIVREETCYLIFEYIDGHSLEYIIGNKGRLSLQKAMEILKQVCSAISYAHRENVIHLDLKPSNILINSQNISKVTDFGIARIAKDTILRTSGETTGTFAYMSPEQHFGSYDKSSDIYSLGVTFYEILAGELPFKGPDFLAQKREMVYRPASELVPDLPKQIDNIINKCLQSDKEKRYKTIDELLREMR
jgi:tetratricopeptide (TPR) repeat protein/DNA-binding beta-propeller fold protein YncE